MANILIISSIPHSATAWQQSLSEEHKVFVIPNLESSNEIIERNSIHFLVIDGEFFDKDATLLPLFDTKRLKTLVVGHHWSEERQINALVAGHSGYCEVDHAAKLLLKAVAGILNGDIWINRHLVPKVLDLLIQSNKIQFSSQDRNKSVLTKKLQTLTLRELEVARMITEGHSNKIIAKLLSISERTVKAHLTSIFQKLNVHDRLHLAILIKEFS